MTEERDSNLQPEPEETPAAGPPEPPEAPERPTAPEPPVVRTETERRDRHGAVVTGAPRRTGPSMGQIIVGGFLVLIGTGWLLEAADIADVPWRALLPAALMLIGLGLVFGARTARHGGVIALGVVLTVAVGTASAVEVLVDIPISGGIGEESATVIGPVEAEYRHAIGQYVVDFRSADVGAAGSNTEVSLGIGELVVIVPSDVDLVIDARAGLGNVVVFGEESSGVGPDIEYTSPGAGDAVLRLNVDVAIGQVEVRR